MRTLGPTRTALTSGPTRQSESIARELALWEGAVAVVSLCVLLAKGVLYVMGGQLPDWLVLALFAGVIVNVGVLAWRWRVMRLRGKVVVVVAVGAMTIAAAVGFRGPTSVGAPQTSAPTPGARNDASAPSRDVNGSNAAVTDILATHCTPAIGPAAAFDIVHETVGATQGIVTVGSEPNAWVLQAAAPAAQGDNLVVVDGAEPRRLMLYSVSGRRASATRLVEGVVVDTAVDEAGDLVAFVERVGSNTRLGIWRPTSDQVLVFADPDASVAEVAVSRSGTTMNWTELVTGAARVVVSPTAAFQPRIAVVNGRYATWANEETLVYSAPFGEGHAIFAAPAAGGDAVRLTTPVQEDDIWPAVDPTCRSVVFTRSGAGGSVALFRTTGGTASPFLLDEAGAEIRVSFSW